MRKSKKIARLQRAKKTRARQRLLGAVRLVINRTPKNTYAQIIKTGCPLSGHADEVLAQASTLEADVRKVLTEQGIKHFGNIETAKVIGKVIAERALKCGVSKVSFDRSGFKFHGRVRALADSVTENGIII